MLRRFKKDVFCKKKQKKTLNLLKAKRKKKKSHSYEPLSVSKLASIHQLKHWLTTEPPECCRVGCLRYMTEITLAGRTLVDVSNQRATATTRNYKPHSAFWESLILLNACQQIIQCSTAAFLGFFEHKSSWPTSLYQKECMPKYKRWLWNARPEKQAQKKQIKLMQSVERGAFN